MAHGTVLLRRFEDKLKSPLRPSTVRCLNPFKTQFKDIAADKMRYNAKFTKESRVFEVANRER